MAKKLQSTGLDMFSFWCPGCNERHSVTVNLLTPGSGWCWNGSIDSPTFTPSLLVQCGHYIAGHSGSCWCSFNKEHPDDPAPFTCQQCHSFVRDGRIQFLSDSTHALAGQTVEIPDWDSRPHAHE